MFQVEDRAPMQCPGWPGARLSRSLPGTIRHRLAGDIMSCCRLYKIMSFVSLSSTYVISLTLQLVFYSSISSIRLKALRMVLCIFVYLHRLAQCVTLHRWSVHVSKLALLRLHLICAQRFSILCSFFHYFQMIVDTDSVDRAFKKKSHRIIVFFCRKNFF